MFARCLRCDKQDYHQTRTRSTLSKKLFGKLNLADANQHFIDCLLHSTECTSLFPRLGENLSDSRGQTYCMWKATLDLTFRIGQIKRKMIIDIQQLEAFPEYLQNTCIIDGRNFLSLLQDLCEHFFCGFSIRILPIVDITGMKITERHHVKTEQRQLLVSDIQKFLHSIKRKDSSCIVGVTWTDLYPAEDLNFVLGEGSCALKCAVACFGRFEPQNYLISDRQIASVVDGDLIWKMFKVVTHEVCHVFGLQHCPYFECAMNESNSVQEAMSQPLLLCPVCLRKLYKICQFDIIDRYERLQMIFMDIHAVYPHDGFVRTLSSIQEILNLVETLKIM